MEKAAAGPNREAQETSVINQVHSAEKKGQLIVLIGGSSLTRYNYLRAYVTDEISKSSKKFPSQKQTFLGKSHRTGTLVDDTNLYLIA